MATAKKKTGTVQRKVAAAAGKPTGAAAKAKKPAASVARAAAKVAKKVAHAPSRAKAVSAPAKASESAAATKRVDVGSRAPAFTLKDQSGLPLSSNDLKGKPYVLYLYPKDDTPGCTTEACGFRDADAKFGKRGLRVIGVSPDGEASHQKFATKYGLPFTLLSDPDKTLIQAYGAWVEKQNYGRTYMGVERSTFLVGPDGTIRKAWRGVRVPGHIEAVLAAEL